MRKPKILSIRMLFRQHSKMFLMYYVLPQQNSEEHGDFQNNSLPVLDSAKAIINAGEITLHSPQPGIGTALKSHFHSKEVLADNNDTFLSQNTTVNVQIPIESLNLFSENTTEFCAPFFATLEEIPSMKDQNVAYDLDAKKDNSKELENDKNTGSTASGVTEITYNQLEDMTVKEDLVDYASAGAYGDKGNARLTKKGWEIQLKVI